MVEDLTGTCWRDDLWLQHRGGLNLANALEYFGLSPFYAQDPDGGEVSRVGGPGLQQMLRQGSSGVEYVLQDAQPPHLFVIRRQLRAAAGAAAGAGEAVVQACYYILDGTVYQAPSLYAALTSRAQRCMYGIRAAFEAIQADLDPLAAGAGDESQRRAQGALEAEAAARQAPPRQLTAADREQEQRIAQNLHLVLAKHPLPRAAFLERPAAAAAAAEGTAQRQTLSLAATAAPVPGVPSGAGSKEG